MNFCQVLGNTWMLEGKELIPVYRLEGGRCILLDSGLHTEQEALAQALLANSLTPVGVFATHAHRDHMGNAFWLREAYGAKICLSEGEAALCLSIALYRSGYDTYTPRQVAWHYGHLIGRADETVSPAETEKSFCGVSFGVVHTPGHSPDHICISTPDSVLYLGDAMMAGDYLHTAKLPYHYTHETARESMELLRTGGYALYIAAHQAVTDRIDRTVEENLAVLDEHGRDLAALATVPMTHDQLLAAGLRHWKAVTTYQEKSARFDRNVRTLMEYLVDTRALEITVQDGVRHYCAPPV